MAVPPSPAPLACWRRVLALVQQMRDAINRDERTHLGFQKKMGRGYEPFCACLDALEDTTLALARFTGFKDGGSADYLAAFGLLQALVVQQDALDQAEEALRLPTPDDRALTQIREHRNNIAGHPTQRRNSGAANFLVRTSLRGGKLTYLKTTAEGGLKPVNLDVAAVLAVQGDKVCARLETVARAARLWAEA